MNLADLHRAAGRDAEGLGVLQRALEIHPENAELHHALGLLLVRIDQADKALLALRRASELAPEHARYAYVLAVALQSRGEIDAARRAVEPFRGRPEIEAFLVSLDLPARPPGP